MAFVRHSNTGSNDEGMKFPKADRVMLLLLSAGASGIPEGALRSAEELPRSLLDDLLDALVAAGQVKVMLKDGKSVCHPSSRREHYPASYTILIFAGIRSSSGS